MAVTDSTRAPLIGIDFGTSCCRAALIVDGLVQPIPLEKDQAALPSVIAFAEDGRLLVGNRALRFSEIIPQNYVWGIKRLLGQSADSEQVRAMAANVPYQICADEEGDVAINIKNIRFSAWKVASFLFGEIRQRSAKAIAQPICRAVIGVPSCYGHRQRQALIKACQQAGLEVERLVNETTAMAVAYGYAKKLTRRRLLVINLGAGYFEAAICEATGDEFELIASTASTSCSGIEFDSRVVAWLRERFARQELFALLDNPSTRQRLRNAAQIAKIDLGLESPVLVSVPQVATRLDNPVDLDVMLHQSGFEGLVGDLEDQVVAACADLLQEQRLAPSAVDDVLLVGGLSNLGILRKKLENFLGHGASSKIQVSPDAANWVAMGTALIANSMQSSAPSHLSLKFSERLTADVGMANREGKYWRLFERSMRLPSETKCSVVTDEQGTIELALIQHEKRVNSTSSYLGMLRIETFPKTTVELRFTISHQGLLTFCASTASGTKPHGSLITAHPSPMDNWVLASMPGVENSPKSAKKKPRFARLFRQVLGLKA